MNATLKKLIFVSLYLMGDSYYVVTSNPVYQQAVFNIAQHDMPVALRLPSIAYAYGSMALGWYYLALPALESWSTSIPRPLAGLCVGLIYGIAVIGTFNFTLNLMFEGWGGMIMYRDLTWGLSWSTVTVFLYSVFSSSNLEKKIYRRY